MINNAIKIKTCTPHLKKGPMKGGQSVERRPKMLRNVRCRLGNECQCQAEVECGVSNVGSPSLSVGVGRH